MDQAVGREHSASDTAAHHPGDMKAGDLPKASHGGSTVWWPPSRDHVVLYKANPLRFEYFDRFIGSWKDVKVLDVGCGGGYACEFLARRQAVVFGTDIMGIRSARKGREKGKLPVAISPKGSTRIVYFGAARKPV